MLRRFAISGLLLWLAIPAGARTRPHYGGTLRIETKGDPWQLPDGVARRLVLDTLTTVDAGGAAEPALAIRWQSSDGAHRWEFVLRANVRFQDGTPLTADAVAASLDQACAASRCPWRAVHAIGAAVVLVADSPMPSLPDLLSQSEYAIARQSATGGMVGTGPYRVTGFADGALTLAANDDSWQGRPFADFIRILPHRSIRDQWLDLSVGNADVVEVPAEMLRQAQQQRLNVMESGPVELLALTIAPQGPLANLEMRESIALAVDRAALCNVIYQKQGEITGSLLPESLSGYGFLFPTDRDLERARALRGGATLPPLGLAADDTGASTQLASERLALNLHEAGFNVQIVSGGTAPLALRHVYLEAGSPRAALNEMLAQLGQNGTVSGTDAAAVWQAEQAALANETIVPLLWLPRAWAVGERVRDLRLSPDGMPLVANAAQEGSQ